MMQQLNYKNAVFKDLTIEGGVIENLTNCYFHRCKFINVVISSRSAVLINTQFVGCSFNGFVLDFSYWFECYVLNCEFLETDFSSSSFINCGIADSSFIFCDLNLVVFIRGSFDEVNIDMSTSTGSSYRFSRFDNSEFRDTNFSDSDFSYTSWNNTSITSCSLDNVCATGVSGGESSNVL